jgi:AcrR family transcriptional regulator
MGVKPRERLMQVADELFYLRGLRAVGIDEIIEKASTAKATLYAHFPTKDDLITAYLLQRGAAWREHLESELIPYAEDPIGRIDAIFRVLSEGCGKAGFRGCPFINAAVEYPERSHPAHQVVIAQRHWVWKLFHRAAVDARVGQATALADQLTLLYDSALVGSQLAGDTTPSARAREAASTLVAAASRRQRLRRQGRRR